MRSRADTIDRIVKILRLARGAGTEGEAEAALLHAQRLMFAHGVDEGDLEDADAGAAPRDAAIGEVIVDDLGRAVSWKEYVAAIVAENFRCVYIISRARGGEAVRYVFVGRGEDARVAGEAYQAATLAAAHLCEAYVERRAAEAAATSAPATSAAAPDAAVTRASYLTGFLRGLQERFDEQLSRTALVLVADHALLAHARALVNGGDAPGGGLPQDDADATREGHQTGRAYGDRTRSLPEE